MKFFNDENKTLTWYNKNYFFVGTIVFVVLNISLFAFLGNNYARNLGIGGPYVWNGVFDISNLLRSFIDVFDHGYWLHVIFNMATFLVCGIYIERKVGTFKFVLMILGFAFLAGNMTTAARNTVNHYGASGLIYFCYAYIIIDFIFALFKEKRNKTNLILGIIILVLIYGFMIINYNNSTGIVTFTWYPHDLLYNAAHYSSFFAGIIVTLMIKIGQPRKI